MTPEDYKARQRAATEARVQEKDEAVVRRRNAELDQEFDERIARENAERGRYVLVRCSLEMVEQLTERESNPVVFMRLERREDGTFDLWLRNSTESEPPLA